jgi:Protein of unknown function (DUF4239)
MHSTTVSLLVFACSFGASLLAIVGRRYVPAHHMEGDSKDVIKLALGLISTLTALVLGLLISSTYSAFQMQQTEVQQLGVHLFEVDRALAQFGPETHDQRDQLRQMITGIVLRVWPAEGVPTRAPGSLQEEGENLFAGIVALTPKTELQRLAQNHVLQLLESISETRHLLIQQSQGELSRPILFGLLFWVTALFVGFGLLARFNATVITSLFVGSVSVAGAVFLIVEMSRPYGGWVQISSAPLRAVLAQMGQ